MDRNQVFDGKNRENNYPDEAGRLMRLRSSWVWPPSTMSAMTDRRSVLARIVWSSVRIGLSGLNGGGGNE